VEVLHTGWPWHIKINLMLSTTGEMKLQSASSCQYSELNFLWHPGGQINVRGVQWNPGHPFGSATGFKILFIPPTDTYSMSGYSVTTACLAWNYL